jgi:hypothetical protein
MPAPSVVPAKPELFATMHFFHLSIGHRRRYALAGRNIKWSYTLNHFCKSVSTYLLAGAPIQSGFFLDSYYTQQVLLVTHPK